MPRPARHPCKCGCGQATAATTRTRALECALCGAVVRMSREAFSTVGVPVCGCGGQMLPRCLEDRAAVPGEIGRVAWAELVSRPLARGGCAPVDPVFAARARKAAATRAARRRWDAVRDGAEEVVPF